MEGVHLGVPVDPVFVPGAGRDPDGPPGARHPCPVVGPHGQNSPGDVDELVVLVPVPGDEFAGVMVLAVLRHKWTGYRKPTGVGVDKGGAHEPHPFDGHP
ncbi:hypothetical protein GCM10018782_12500 [Streptomyces griseoaurantiacus]|nr:hypothetical protein GCM10018782_12500 [Streptomyces griseoaurantiacus]